MSMLEAALAYCKMGWFVIPCNGKKPIPAEWQKRIADEEQVIAWWTQHPDANIGLLLGKNVVRVDADGQEAVQQFYAMLKEQPSTMEYATPSGGRGWLFSVSKHTPTIVLWKGFHEHEELRLQGSGSQCILPPSPGYHWISDKELLKMPRAIDDAQMNLRAKSIIDKSLPPEVVVDDEQIRAALSFVPADNRDVWLRVGMALHSASDSYLAVWLEWSSGSQKFVPGECEELWQTFRCSGGVTLGTLFHVAKEHGYKQKREAFDDVGNGKALAKACRNTAVYCRQWREWLAWDGKRWQRDSEFEVVEIAKLVVRSRYERATSALARLKTLPDDDARGRKLMAVKKAMDWCRQSESAKRIHWAVDMARSEAGVLIEASAFNNHPHLLNCVNGELNLRTGELSEHCCERRSTQLSPVEYWPQALCPRWEQFLLEVFDAKVELAAWVQKLLGYCTTGEVSEHVLPILYGSGRNGKSTLINVMLEVLGLDYAGVTTSGFLAQSKGEQHPERLVKLYSRRFVADLETGDGMRMNEELVKRLTGNDVIRARDLYEKSWEFKPTHKLVLATNYEPRVRGADDAIWSRIKLVPFNVSFAGREDHRLAERLREEYPGVLRWLVEGSKRWYEEGLGEPPTVKEATAAYRNEQDTVGRWFEECIEKNAGAKTSKVAVATSYRGWCLANGLHATSDKEFGRALTRLGVAREGSRWYVGIKML